MTYCPGSTCDPCKPKPTAGALYIEGNVSLVFSTGAGGDGNSYQCQAVYQINTIPADATGRVVSGSTTITWHAYSVATPSVPITGFFVLTSAGHYGGWYGEFPPVQYTKLPKTYLGVDVDIGHGVTQDPPALTGGTLYTGQAPPWNDFLLTPLATQVKVEQI